MKKTKYNDNSLVSLKGADQVRKVPSVIFGSDGLDGCKHSIFEILSNSIDEAREGYGNSITIKKYSDNSIEISDKGRGIPIDFNTNENKYNWELAFCTMYAGGKYNKTKGDNYSYSLGLNGLGLCSTQFASEYMDVTSDNGVWRYTLHFKKGENVTIKDDEKGFIRSKSTGKTGTTIKWKPDLEVFTEIAVDSNYYREILRRQAIVNDGLEFVFSDEEADGTFVEEHYRYENGIEDYLKEIVADKAITTPQVWSGERSGSDRADKEDYKVKLKVAFAFSNSVRFIEHYHNSSWLEHGGSPDKALRQAFVYQIDSYLKTTNKYNKDESKITFTDIEDCLVFISSNFSTVASFENQTKKSITNKFIYETMTEWLKHNLEVYFKENPDEALRIAEQIIVNKRSRESAEKTRNTIKKQLTGNIDLSNRVEKFVDCRSKDIAHREIYIVEGDSALGSVKLARDAEFQAIMPVRGKILNCLTSSMDKIFKNDIICNLVKVLGCGVEVKSKANKELSNFSIANLKWNKIVICTDADVDGYHIRTLILTMLYSLMPTLIEDGFVFIAESPLYEINTKDKTYFAYTEAEKTKILIEVGDKKYTIQRSKGLGENEPEMMSLTTMNPATRRLIKVMPTLFKDTSDMFEMLLGNNLDGRKSYISEFGSLYLEAADLM